MDIIKSIRTWKPSNLRKSKSLQPNQQHKLNNYNDAASVSAVHDFESTSSKMMTSSSSSSTTSSSTGKGRSSSTMPASNASLSPYSPSENYTPFVRNSQLYKTTQNHQYENLANNREVTFKVPQIPTNKSIYSSQSTIRANVTAGGLSGPLAKPPPHFMRPKQASSRTSLTMGPSDSIYYQGKPFKVVNNMVNLVVGGAHLYTKKFVCTLAEKNKRFFESSLKSFF